MAVATILLGLPSKDANFFVATKFVLGGSMGDCLLHCRIRRLFFRFCPEGLLREGTAYDTMLLHVSGRLEDIPFPRSSLSWCINYPL